MQTLPSWDLEDDDEPIEAEQSRPQLKSGLDEASFGKRAELEWRLYHRGRFAPEHHTISLATLERLDALFDRLPHAQSMEESIRFIQCAFVHEDERRAALVPLLGVLYPLAYFDDKMPTADIVRLIAHHERRKPATPI
jgi:hypothetical protein